MTNIARETSEDTFLLKKERVAKKREAKRGGEELMMPKIGVSSTTALPFPYY